jgi:hypothetical protein
VGHVDVLVAVDQCLIEVEDDRLFVYVEREVPW